MSERKYTIKNGILHCSGQPCFALGTSYYPSYFPTKVPVAENGDREGEAKKDLAQMAEMGLNVVRIAALGNVSRSRDGGVDFDFPLADSICKIAYDAGVAAMVRVIGYGLAFENYKGARKQDRRNQEIQSAWATFQPYCVHHEGICRDGHDGVAASAKHFAEFPSVAGIQTYNEPHCMPAFDFNPLTIRAFRKWLTERCVCTADEAASVNVPEVPCRTPRDQKLFVEWMIFRNKANNDYLNMLSDASHEGAPGLETVVGMIFPNPVKCVDYFRNAEKLDIIGFDAYTQTIGPNYYLLTYYCDQAESAASLYGKHAWCIELNGLCELPVNTFDRETYAYLGGGLKGLLYYEWRGDCSESPEPDMFGMIYNDGRKTPKYDRAVKFFRLIHKLEPLLTGAEKERSGVAILYSEYADFTFYAKHGQETKSAQHAYRALRMAGVSVDFVRASDLNENVFGIKYLVLPESDCISEEEQAQIDAWKKTGGTVVPYLNDYCEFVKDCDAAASLHQHGIECLYTTDAPYLDVRSLRGSGYRLLCLTNMDPLERVIPANRTLVYRRGETSGVNRVVFHSPDESFSLEFRQCGDHVEITLPQITTGGIIEISR